MKTAKELAEAVESYQKGNQESFNSIYELSSGYLYTCILYVVQDEETARDLLQDTYLEISSKLYQLENADKFLQWATAIANRKCCDYRRKKRDVLLAESEEGELIFETIADDEKLIPESILQDQEKQRLVREVINNLSDIQRLCIIGYYYNEEKQEQIAEELEIPVNTVKSHLNRAKSKIKQGVLEIEKKEDTKLYSLAPFLLLFFAKEAEACEHIPMSSVLRDAVSKSARGNETAGRLAKLGLKAKLGIGAGTVVAVAAVGGLVMAGINRDRYEEADETEQNVYEEERTDNVLDTVSQEADNTETADADADALIQSDEEESPSEGTPEYVELDIAAKYDEFRAAWNGRVFVRKDDKWGLVTYEGEELIPLEYTGVFTRVNDDGQTIFWKDSTYSIFDQDGNLLMETEMPVSCVSDGVVLIIDRNQETLEYDYQYQTLDGEVLYRPDWSGWIGQTGAVGFNEGWAFAEDGSSEIRLAKDGSYISMTDLWAEGALKEEPVEYDDSNSMWEANASSGPSTLMAYPIGVYHNGYYVSRGMNFDDSYGNFYICDSEGKELYKFSMKDFCEYMGYDFWSEDNDWTVYSYIVNGSYCYSYGTIINISITEGGQETYYLLDLSKMDWEINVPYSPDKMIVTDEAVLAEGDSIYLSDKQYWLYYKDGKYGYIDHEGNVVEMFDDACGFNDGKAVVIEDGMAYLIDEDFNRTDLGIEADAVGVYGEIFCLRNGDEMTYLVFPD